MGESSSPRGKTIKTVRIATTHPDGRGVERYRQILRNRLNHFESDSPFEQPEEVLDVDIQNLEAPEIIRAALYAGLEHEDSWSEEEFLQSHGEDSEYSLIINRHHQEMVLFIDGESYPLKPGVSEEIRQMI